jgi:hypothetical protein
MRTYAGVTNDLKHRLRQHNGEIAGGARATTTGRPWRISAITTGFENDKSLAMRYEWFCKVKHCPACEFEEAGCTTGPLRRAFLLQRALGKCSDRGRQLEMRCCDPNMFSCERTVVLARERAEAEMRRASRLCVVEDMKDVNLDPEQVEEG